MEALRTMRALFASSSPRYRRYVVAIISARRCVGGRCARTMTGASVRPASARPDAAAISTAGALCIELACQLECIAKVEGHGFGRSDHALEQAGFGLVFDIADRKRTDAERPPRSEFRAVRHHVQAFDA